ncbi:MAG TPA: cysteine--tRNA ligase [Gemmatales bacterium]|nr:cysteine--tRNA ligase [Gemmatales bacterium]
MALKVYNTLTRQKVSMYVCGPTVYKPAHIGHMVGPVIFDTIKRYLQFLGYQVTWVVNITDVDDKLIVRARELGTTVKELAEKMTADYVACLKKLHVVGVNHMPKATEHIPGMIAIMEKLIAEGKAYAAGGDVYFDVAQDEDYGKLCNRDPEQMEAGARIEVSERKKNPGDFAMWKSAKPGEPAWDSPWGPGRPGWHIECSAMCHALIGVTLDIHGGGLDLQFPHHENELAQSESFTGKTFARFWMHNGLLKMGAAKMAGSVGNVVNIVDLLQQHAAETVRFLLLSTHYRSPIEYSEERLSEVARSLQAFHRFFERYERIVGASFYALPISASAGELLPPVAHEPLAVTCDGLWQRFRDSMDDDFNTAGAIGVLHETLTALNKFADQAKLEDSATRSQAQVDDFAAAARRLRLMGNLLGLFWEAPAAAEGDDLTGGLMELLIELRAELRKAKNFPLADLIRTRLAALGVTLEDRAGGTSWRRPG